MILIVEHHIEMIGEFGPDRLRIGLIMPDGAVFTNIWLGGVKVGFHAIENRNSSPKHVADLTWT
ncbi:MAG TPA: hypothetical protein VHZ55_06840 [Bryobacteraceae bacterium]|nr:hypothetical protein [Bryobacteraceae bacterium]